MERLCHAPCHEQPSAEPCPRRAAVQIAAITSRSYDPSPWEVAIYASRGSANPPRREGGASSKAFGAIFV